MFSVGGGQQGGERLDQPGAGPRAGCRTGGIDLRHRGRDGGFTAEVADACVIIPPLYPDHVTPHTEGLCAVVWHLLVSHPALAQQATKWESM